MIWQSWLEPSCLTLAARSPTKCALSSLSCSATRLLPQLFSTVDTFMVGMVKISTQGVTLREEQSPCFRSSKGIALVATPVNAGSHRAGLARGRQTVAPSCLTWLAPATSLQRLLAKIYYAVATKGLVSVEVVIMNSLHGINHLMVKTSAAQTRINVVTIFD
jgi:hypothetical protein